MRRAGLLGCMLLLAAPGATFASPKSVPESKSNTDTSSGKAAERTAARGQGTAAKQATVSKSNADTSSGNAAERTDARGLSAPAKQTSAETSSGKTAERTDEHGVSAPAKQTSSPKSNAEMSSGKAVERTDEHGVSAPAKQTSVPKSNAETSSGKAAERTDARGLSAHAKQTSASTSNTDTRSGKAAEQAEARSAPRFVWPSLRVLEQVNASEVVEAGGVPVVLRAVVVKDSAQELVQRFADAFRAGGLHVPPGNEQPQLASGAAMLTGVDMYRGLTYTVIIQPQEGGITLVYLGEANHALRREPSADGDVATLPPGAHQVLRVNDEGSRTMSFLVPMSASDVDAFYVQVLGRDGWRRMDGETSIYTRGGEELRLVHEPAEGGLRSVVLVHRGRTRAGQGAATPAP